MTEKRPLSFNEQLEAIQREDGEEEAALRAAAQRRAEQAVQEQPLPDLDELEDETSSNRSDQLSFDEQLDELINAPEGLEAEGLSVLPEPLRKQEPAEESEFAKAQRRIRLARLEYGHDVDGTDGPEQSGPSFE